MTPEVGLSRSLPVLLSAVRGQMWDVNDTGGWFVSVPPCASLCCERTDVGCE